MSQRYSTQQEEFWAGSFGDEYLKRNNEELWSANNLSFFSRILGLTRNVCSILEFGANIGLNMIALQRLIPAAEMSAVEINDKAVEKLYSLDNINVYHQSMLDFLPDYQRDFVFTKTVLIHIDPKKILDAYDIIYKSSKKYICLAEYYNPQPVEVLYRGYSGKLFKRDFAGEMLDRFKNLSLIDYGFVYHRDPVFSQDDITWFLLEKH